MKLEGKMIGAWVTECRQAWIALLAALSTRRLVLDLCGVISVDESGLELLREIYGATRADMITNSPLTKHFADEVVKSKSIRKEGD